MAKYSNIEIDLDARLHTLVNQWLAQVITNRELASLLAGVHATLPAIEPGALDMNTGLSYKPARKPALKPSPSYQSPEEWARDVAAKMFAVPAKDEDGWHERNVDYAKRTMRDGT